MEQELLADEKECSEHVMLVDLGRNDVGKVAQMGSVKVETFMEVERYSHVMHISSTVTGKLLPQLNAWDVMRAALPAGTVSGAPKVSCKERTLAGLHLTEVVLHGIRCYYSEFASFLADSLVHTRTSGLQSR